MKVADLMESSRIGEEPDRPRGLPGEAGARTPEGFIETNWQ